MIVTRYHSVMERASFAQMDCPIARAVDEVGEGWTLLLLREAFKGASTFAQFAAELPITPTTLTRRLETMTERGFLEREVYQTKPQRERYALTEKALELLPILVALGAWGNRWLAPEGPLLVPVDAETGVAMDIAVVDRKTSRPLRPGHVGLRPGRGAKSHIRAAMKKPLVLGGERTRP